MKISEIIKCTERAFDQGVLAKPGPGTSLQATLWATLQATLIIMSFLARDHCQTLC